MISLSVKAAIAGMLLSLVATLAVIVSGWHHDSTSLQALKPAHEALVAERDALGAKVLVLTEENGSLHSAIAAQNNAIALAVAQSIAAKEQQALAKSYADKIARQAGARIADLEADLTDATKTLTDLLDKSWRQSQ